MNDYRATKPQDASLSQPKDQQVCKGDCGESLPISAQYFDRDNSNENGFKGICKICRSEQRRHKDNEEIAERVRMLDKATLKALTGLATSPKADLVSVPHMATCLEHLIGVFGGPQGYAQHSMANYLMAKPGSQNRVKILQMVQQLFIKVSEAGYAQVPLEKMTDEQLRIHKEEQIRKLSNAGLLVFNPDSVEGVDADKKVS